jgi:hypothetical protein
MAAIKAALIKRLTCEKTIFLRCFEAMRDLHGWFAIWFANFSAANVRFRKEAD